MNFTLVCILFCTLTFTSLTTFAQSKFTAGEDARIIFESLKKTGEYVNIQKSLQDPLSKALLMLKDIQGDFTEEHVIEEWIDTESFFCSYTGTLSVATNAFIIHSHHARNSQPKKNHLILINPAFIWQNEAVLISEYNCFKKPNYVE